MQQDNKANIEDIYELTSMQQGMLFHSLYSEGSDAYIEQFCYDLSGELDIEIFKESWQRVVDRHSVLRTGFQWKGISKPVQLVNKNIKLPWDILDWTNLSDEDKISEYKIFIKSDRAKGFNLESAPLMRCTLIKYGDVSYKLVWSFHHILMDGWSYPIIQKEVFSFYEAAKNKTELNLPRPLPYKQYIQWLNKQDKVSAEVFWKNELLGFTNATPLNYKKENVSSAKTESYSEISECEIRLSGELTSQIQNFAKKNQLTLNTVIQGVWSLILSTYLGENDVLFGGVTSGRNSSLKDIETMVGLFINTLPVRIKIDTAQEIIPWLKGLQINHLERDNFSYTPLIDIQEWSNIKKGSQLFENIIVFENYPLDKSLENGIAGIKISNLEAFERTNFPLIILVAPGDRLQIKIVYENDKYKSFFINQILNNFETLFKNISENKLLKISELSVITEEEKNKIIFDRNDTNMKFPDDKCVHQLFEETALKFPDKIAVEFGNNKYSYKELNERANQVAHYLIKTGIRPDNVAGICIERSYEMVIALLGILKAGAAYLPLDSTYPLERLSFMIEDTDIPILITTKNILDKLPSTERKVLLMDEDADLLTKENTDNPVTEVNSSNLAYVIYTSGSTGKPKGVLMIQKALVNLLYWQLNGQKFEKNLRVLQFTTLSFDVSFQEIFSTWYSGGTLIIIKDEERQDLSKVLEIIKNKNIQRIYLPFIALQELSKLFSESEIKSLELKEVITAGEQLQITPAIINFFNKLKDYTFSNHYGPSEAHVVTSYTLSGDPNTWIKYTPIGKPVYNTQMFVLNSDLKPVPDGVTGDLYIGGIQLVRGYNNRVDLTDDKFVPNPFFKNRNDWSEKIYKTGDIARYLPDGNIEYLGRDDNQIKLRGYRIELGEIENVLAKFPGLKNVVVIVSSYNSDEKRLIAYIVNTLEVIPKTSELRIFLKSQLPDYMIPSEFIFLKEMPLTPTGKVDKKSLPAPESVRINESNNYQEPNDELELQLVKIWEKVLGVKPIGIKDNFFEIGGHSLLALRLFGYIEKLTGKKLALSTLFNYPTISQIADILKDEGWTKPWKSLVAVKPGGSKIPFFCVPPAAGTALHFQPLLKYIPKDQPFYVLESLGLDGKEEPHNDIKEMAKYYVKEIQMLQPEGPYLIGGRCFGGRVVFEMAQQFYKLNQEVALLAIFDTWPPFTAPPPSYMPPKRNAGHFFSRSFHHVRKGEFIKVVKNYSSNKYIKFKWYTKIKFESIFSSKRKKLFKHIMMTHFNAQDRYVANKYPGKITLVECATFKEEYRNGWRNLAEGGFEYYMVPDTDHKTIIKEPKLKDFAEKLNFVLQKTHNEIEAKTQLNVNNKIVTKSAVVI